MSTQTNIVEAFSRYEQFAELAKATQLSWVLFKEMEEAMKMIADLSGEGPIRVEARPYRRLMVLE